MQSGEQHRRSSRVRRVTKEQNELPEDAPIIAMMTHAPARTVKARAP